MNAEVLKCEVLGYWVTVKCNSGQGSGVVGLGNFVVVWIWF